MSDGTLYNDSGGVLELLADEGDGNHFAHASRAPQTRSSALPELDNFAAWLPRLGPVLWISRRCEYGQARSCPDPRSGPVLLKHRP